MLEMYVEINTLWDEETTNTQIPFILYFIIRVYVFYDIGR